MHKERNTFWHSVTYSLLILVLTANATVYNGCYNIIYGCNACDDSIGYKVCTSCLDGLYLLKNSTSDNTQLSFCVPDCPHANPRFVNNQVSMQCLDCGEGCTACNIYTGCEVCLGVDQQTSFLYKLQNHPISLSSTFNRCQKCHRVNNNQHCMSCTADSNTFEATNLISCIKCTFGISDSDCTDGSCVTNYENCDYSCSNSKCQCIEGNYNLYQVCAACATHKCLNCDLNGCFECNRGYSAISVVGKKISSCAQCNLNSIFLNDCSSCDLITDSGSISNIQCTMCESSLVLSGSTCEVSCSRGSYIQSTTLENKGVFENNTCQSCDANCYECALQGTNKCTSCNKGSYLTLSTAGEISGLCSNISNDVLILNVFVKAKYIENSGDGSYSNPFGNIAKALSYIEEQASMYSGATVNIYLLKGDHFMTRNFAHYNYQKSKTSQYSYNYDVNIQPVFCGQTLGGHPFGTSDADCINNSDKITVYYQMGSTFHFTIPKSLTISSVIFDALDSSLVPTEKCLNENAQCCTLNLDKTMSVNNLNPNPPSVCSVQTIQTEECKAAFGSSLFQFGYSDSLSNIDGVGTLALINCTFQNFFYDFNSFIGLTNGHGKISISETTFDKFSNCGSIIRDTAEYPTNLNYINLGMQTSTTTTYRDSMFTSNLYQNKYFIKPSAACKSDSCASINIESSTFQNFNYLKTGGLTYHKVSSNSNMKYQGLILNLNNFYGTVAFYNNQISSLKFAYNNCEEVYNSATSLDTANIWGTPTILQAKTLIYINVKSSAVEIYGNTFSKCNSLLGLIYLQRSSDYFTPILIHGNIFTLNSAIMGSNLIKLYLYTKNSFKDLFSNEDMICAGVQISNNNFTQNIGCFNTIGAIQSICYTDGVDADPSAQFNHYSTPQPMDKDYLNNLSKDGIISFSALKSVILPSSSVSIDSNQYLMTNNIFDQNYAGLQSEVVELINIRRINIVSDSYINNCGIFQEALAKYGSITSSGDISDPLKPPGAWLFAYYGEFGSSQSMLDITNSSNIQDFFPVAPLLIDGSFYILTTGLIFNNNAMQELKSAYVSKYYPANAITIRRSQGNIYLNLLTVQNYKGYDLAKLESIYGSIYYQNNVKTANPTERDNSGIPNSLQNFPVFTLDYGFKNSIINFAKPTTINSLDFLNFFDYFEMKGLAVSNISHYNPNTDIAMFIDIGNDLVKGVISNFTIQDVDLILGSTGMIRFKTSADLSVSDGVVTNLNTNSYLYDTDKYAYVGMNGGVFAIYSVSNISSSIAIQTFSNITFSNIISRKCGAFYFESESNVQTFQQTTVTLINLNFTFSYSYIYGVVCLESGNQNVHIIDSEFNSNTGVNGESDLRIIKTGGLEVNRTLFTLFQSTALENNGQSITFTMNTPFVTNVKFNDILLKCTNNVYDTFAYRDYAFNYATYLLSSSPIVLYPGSLSIYGSEFADCINSKYGGIINSNLNSIINIDNCLFDENCANYGGALYLVQSTLSITNTQFLNNYANYGGSIYGEFKAIISIFDNNSCFFSNAFTDGCCIYLLGSSSISMSNTEIAGSDAWLYSSAVYLQGSVNSTITNSSFHDIVSGGTPLKIVFTQLDITNITIYDNFVRIYSGGIDIAFSYVNIKDSTFYYNNSENGTMMLNNSDVSMNGGFISISSGSNITLTNSTFSYGYALNGGTIFVSGSSKLELFSCAITNSKALKSGGAIYAMRGAEINLEDLVLTNNSAEVYGSDLYMDNCIVWITYSILNINPKVTPVFASLSEFDCINCVFNNLYPESNYTSDLVLGGAIYASNMNVFTLYNCSFNNFKYAKLGGAIYLLASNDLESIKTYRYSDIKNCLFTNNSAKDGGAIFINNAQNIFIERTNFTSNSASSISNINGYGGAIYYNSIDSYSKLNFYPNNRFINNNASIAGGALYWNYNQPENMIENNIYSNNIAEIYGDSYACFSQTLKSITESQYKSVNHSRRQLDVSQGATSISLPNQQSGGAIPIIYLALVDQFGQIVRSDSSSTATLSITGSASGVTYIPTLTGQTIQISSNGVFKFSDVTFTAKPGLTYSLSFSTTGIDSSKPSNSAYMKSVSKTTTAIDFSISLRNCVLGEYFSSTGACIECKGPDYYSISTQSEPGSCKSCQTLKMYCYGGSNIGPKPGYWRSSNTTDNFIGCLYTGACLGYIAPSNNNLGECFTGYQGILCADCQVGFSRTTNYKCSKCPNPVWNIIRLILILIAVIVAVIIIVKTTLAGALQKKNVQSVYLKLLMNHFQLLSLTSSFNLKWPGSVDEFFTASQPVAEVCTQIISFDCLIDQRQNGGHNLIDIYYVKMIMYALLPIAMVIGSYIIWTIYYCFVKKNSKAKKLGRVISSLIIMFLLIHPSLVHYMFSNFECKTIDSESRVTENLNIICWGSQHIIYSSAVALPSIVIWGFGIPLFAWILLARNKEDIDRIEIREKYGFLFNGFKVDFYFWESVNMYRKICIIFIAVFLKFAGSITQALVVLFVLIIFLIVNLRYMPYSFHFLNNMELISIITCMLTIYCGIFFLSDMPNVYNSSDTTVKQDDNGLRLNTDSKWILFSVILSSNFIFFTYWSYKMIGEVKHLLRTKTERLYLYLCLCGNERRLKDEKYRREIQDENDILKEEFDRQLNEIKKLWSSELKDGRLVLNRVNIGKSALYLNPTNYLKSITSRKDPTEDEIKVMKRKKRRAIGDKYHMILTEHFSSLQSFDKSTVTKQSDSQFRNQNIIGSKFTDTIDDFLEICDPSMPSKPAERVNSSLIDYKMDESNAYLNKTSSRICNHYDGMEESKTPRIINQQLGTTKFSNNPSKEMSFDEENDIFNKSPRVRQSINKNSSKLSTFETQKQKYKNKINIMDSSQNKKKQASAMLPIIKVKLPSDTNLSNIKEEPINEDEEFIQEKLKSRKIKKLNKKNLKINSKINNFVESEFSLTPDSSSIPQSVSPHPIESHYFQLKGNSKVKSNSNSISGSKDEVVGFSELK